MSDISLSKLLVREGLKAERCVSLENCGWIVEVTQLKHKLKNIHLENEKDRQEYETKYLQQTERILKIEEENKKLKNENLSLKDDLKATNDKLLHRDLYTKALLEGLDDANRKIQLLENMLENNKDAILRNPDGQQVQNTDHTKTNPIERPWTKMLTKRQEKKTHKHLAIPSSRKRSRSEADLHLEIPIPQHRNLTPSPPQVEKPLLIRKYHDTATHAGQKTT